MTTGRRHRTNFSIFHSTILGRKTNAAVQSLSSALSDSLPPHGLQHIRPPHPSPSPRTCSNSYPLSQWCYPTILSSVVPFSSCLQSFPTSGSFKWVSSSHQVAKVLESASASILPVNIQYWFPSGLTGLISLLLSDPQESSPAPTFKIINSLVLSPLCGPTFTSIQDYWKNHSFDYVDLCWQSDVSAF